ncbi:hypothetical protein COEREDRAFT_82643 [Coemansia reversa NRRL 1564]|uniref:Uncharacterized protein n=1 Tax=Coemansia reversa (strain ATCC 12441 / NRRL 1564) TaxID=763665 RepID=A0A2G5B6E0_COERN|nr:hypothetical protein COEREDRAFT_82643 [Coemansia reversa NRRL 1564]|eukprot:PIA14613.1 hypothetical protein COEREDRAFT_82643 [Coemansia reversa NRRL 1564]
MHASHSRNGHVRLFKHTLYSHTPPLNLYLLRGHCPSSLLNVPYRKSTSHLVTNTCCSR